MQSTNFNASSFKLATMFILGLTLASIVQPGSALVCPPVHAGVTVANDEAETVFTSSEDGKTIYMWQYYSSKPPKFIGKSEAILSE